MNRDLIAYRFASAVTPAIVSLFIFGMLAWLFLLSSEGGPRAMEPDNTTIPLVKAHLIPAAALSAFLLVLSRGNNMREMRFRFICGNLLLAIVVLLFELHVWLPRLKGGWRVDVQIEPLIHVMPFVATGGALLGVFVGSVLSKIPFRAKGMNVAM